MSTAALAREAASDAVTPSALDALHRAIEHAAEVLPAQGPITVFIHHNTLHALEDLTFEEAVLQGARLFGCQPYLPETRYRSELDRGRIRTADLEAVLRSELGAAADEPILGFGTRLEIRLGLLSHPVLQAPAAELRWFVAETDALNRYREDAAPEVRERFLKTARQWILQDVLTPHAPASSVVESHARHLRQALSGLFEHFRVEQIARWDDATWEAFALRALWRICRDGVHGVPGLTTEPAGSVRHRELLLRATGVDIDGPVNELLIRFCSAFLDQGQSAWPLPARDRGFLASFYELYHLPGGPPDQWLGDLRAELDRLADLKFVPLISVYDSLKQLGVGEAEWEDYLKGTLLALRGWAGMICQVEQRSDRVPHPIPDGSLLEYLAVRLLLERLALKSAARQTLGYSGPLHELRSVLRRQLPREETASVDQRAFLVFQLAQLFGWPAQQLHRLSKRDWAVLVGEIEAFSNVERRRVFHAAYELRYRNQCLDAFSLHGRRPATRIASPAFQVVCCLDEREESFRRHLEEQSPRMETFGAAGFFNVPMYYRGSADAHFVPLCPIVVRPNHWVTEEVVYTLGDVHRRRAKTRRALGAAMHQAYLGSRSLTGGALLTAGLGILASIPLVARVLMPRLSARIWKSASQLVQPPGLTNLTLERTVAEPPSEDPGLGFSIAEMANMAERLLRDIGLTGSFAPLVAIIGHGSNSVNNPHRSAYECGACGGNAGGPNARAAARMLNDPRVRIELSGRGIAIPAATVFLGGLHNTCNDAVTFLDLDRLPKSHQEAFEELQRLVEEACDRNAHERCRRFQSAPLNLTFQAARRHVEARAEDLAQTRPECGHATNAVCYVGRRSRTRGLYLDRRTFLTSYDPTADTPDAAILTRLLQAAVPVCGGINLEYWFSYVDPAGWGCGTKLPHNVTSLLGIMDGAASDLRPGLPWQMVEIHEPVRLLFIIETRPETLLRIMDQQPGIGRLIRNRWVQLATLDPNGSRIDLFEGGRFREYRPESVSLPEVAHSVDWYRGWRDHLGFAVVRSGCIAAEETAGV